MGKEVEEGEEYGEGLLHAHEAVEGPFAMVLDDWFQHWRVPRYACVRDNMLTHVVTIRGTCPEDEAKVERWGSQLEGDQDCPHLTFIRRIVAPFSQFSSTQTYW